MAQRKYRIWDFILQSAIELPELEPAKTGGPQFTFAFSRRKLKFEGTWYHSFRLMDETAWLHAAKSGPEYVLRFPDLADFLFCSDRGTIICFAAQNAPVASIRHLLLDQVLPLVLSTRGKFLLHASCVVLPGGAVGFIGESGRGKSTLAASFSGLGFPILTDDCILVEKGRNRIVAVPNYPGVRVWSDSKALILGRKGPRLPRVAHYLWKQRLTGESTRIQFQRTRVPLTQLFLLALPEAGQSDVRTEAIPPQRAVVELLKYAFRLDVTDERKLSQEFFRVVEMANSIPLAFLTYPRDFARIGLVQEAVLEHVRDRRRNENSLLCA